MRRQTSQIILNASKFGLKPQAISSPRVNFFSTQINIPEGTPYEPSSELVFFTTKSVSDPLSKKVSSLVEETLALNTVEIQQFLDLMSNRLGVSKTLLEAMKNGPSVPLGGAAPAAAAAPEPVKEKEFFELKLSAVDAKAKIKVIKEVRTITGLGLKEAKELVEKAPVSLKDGLKKDEAEKLKAVLVEAGATVELV